MNEEMSQQLYQDQPISQDEIQATIQQEQRITNIISQTSPENHLEEIEWRIRGFRRDSRSKTWKKIKEGMPEPNPLLVSRYISYLGSLLTDNVRFTNLSANDINRLMKLIIEYLTDDLDSNAEEYDLEDTYTERTRIGHIILNSTFFVLKRAENGRESNKIWRSLTLSEDLNPGNNKKGFVDNLKFWK